MNTLRLAFASATILGFGIATADTVDQSNVTTFQSGTPALAAEVNTTLQALITAIDDNAARVAALEASASSLTPPSPEGSTYCVMTFSGSVGAGDPDPGTGQGAWAGTATGVAMDELTFTSSTQVSLNVLTDDFYEAVVPTNILVDQSEAPGIETATWSMVGNTVTITFPDGEQDAFAMSPDGNVIVRTLAEIDRSSDNSGNWFGTDLSVGVRAASCP